MSEKTATGASATMPQMYPYNRFPYNGTSYAVSGQGLNIPGQSALANMSNLRNNLPTPATASDFSASNNGNRSGYNHNLLVLPTGQAMPWNTTYGNNQSINLENNGAIQYGSLTNYNGYPNMISPALSNWNMHYGAYAQPMPRPNGIVPIPAYPVHSVATHGIPMMNHSVPSVVVTDTYKAGMMSYKLSKPFAPYSLELGSYVSRLVGDDHVPLTPIASIGEHSLGYLQTMYATAQQYVAGPVQPLKTMDNKGYHLVNIEEILNQEPPIPRAVPALWTNQEEMSLAKCLQNPEGITNIYIRGFMPDTTDEDLERYAARFGEIESCKAIIDQDTGNCKGFGFVMYYSPAAAENCIRGFFHLGFQASYAQKSRNSRLKDLEDRSSTNIYCTGVPLDWNESDLSKHFLPFQAISTKICRDVPSGVSKEVGFARFESREIAERVVKEYHAAMNEHDSVKLHLRFADTKAQKQLKQQSQERRNWRSREYSYSVEHTPSPTVPRLNVNHHVSPAGSYPSPAAISNNFTPATSVSPPDVQGGVKVIAPRSAWPIHGGLQTITNASATRPVGQSVSARPVVEAASSVTVIGDNVKTKTPSPKKLVVKIEAGSGKENVTITPKSS